MCESLLNKISRIEEACDVKPCPVTEVTAKAPQACESWTWGQGFMAKIRRFGHDVKCWDLERWEG